jgi:hypothetical protein
MESPPEKPQSINEQLRQLPAYQAMLAQAEAPTQTPAYVPVAVPMTASRQMAALMQIKDTAAILLLLSDGSLLLGIFFGFSVPGLVLYGLRWLQVRGWVGRTAIISQAVLSLLHELFWMCALYGEKPGANAPDYPVVLTALYGIGAVLSIGQLLAALSDAAEEGYYD